MKEGTNRQVEYLYGDGNHVTGILYVTTLVSV
jgi:hypothetical protein